MALRMTRKLPRVIDRNELATRLKTQYEKLGKVIDTDPELMNTDPRILDEAQTLTTELAVIVQSMRMGKVDRRIHDEVILEESRNHFHKHRHVTV